MFWLDLRDFHAIEIFALSLLQNPSQRTLQSRGTNSAKCNRFDLAGNEKQVPSLGVDLVREGRFGVGADHAPTAAKGFTWY